MKRMKALLSRARHLLGRGWSMLRHPTRTYEEVREEPLGETLQYFLLLLLMLALILLIGGAVVYSWFIAPILGEHQLFRWLGWLGVVLVVPFVLVTGFIALVLGGLILHLFVWLLGGKQGKSQTFKALAFGSTPLILSLWFLPVALITMIWSLVLIVIGIRDMQKMSNVRATISALLPPALILVLAFVVRALL